jgi:putative transposase
LEGKADADVILEDEVLWYKGRLWVPDSVDLRKMILQEEHDSKVAGHMGQETPIELVRRNFFWPQMDQGIEDYVPSCPDCQKNQAARHTHYGLLRHLKLAYRPWAEISMDFIVDLPV